MAMRICQQRFQQFEVQVRDFRSGDLSFPAFAVMDLVAACQDMVDNTRRSGEECQIDQNRFHKSLSLNGDVISHMLVCTRRF